VTDRNALDSPELGLELLSALHHLYPAEFKLDRAKTLISNTDTLNALRHNVDPTDIAATWNQALASFRLRAAPYLLYH
jgi:hypothetical protein